MAVGDGLGQSSFGDHKDERRSPDRGGGCRQQGAWRAQSVCRGQFGVSHLWRVQSHPQSAGLDASARRPSQKGDGMKLSRRDFGLGAAAALVLGAGALGYRRFLGPWYAPTAYDDLLHQIVDRRPAAELGAVAAKAMPNFNVASLAA